MTPETGGPERADGSPTKVGYLIGAVMALLIIVGIYFALTAGGSDDPTAAHLGSDSGSTNGIQPDERTGTKVAVGSFDLKTTSRAAGCTVKLNLPNEGQDHLTRDDPVPEYGTVPPTSGDHIGPPLQQADGAYSETPLPQDVVHSLEHGRIAIQYDPDLPEKDQLALKGLYDSAYSGALLFPNPEMPYAVAATGWSSLIGCPDWQGAKTINAIRAFAIETQNKGPEPIDIFPSLEGPKFMDFRES